MDILLFGCRIYISPLFIALITLILFFDQSGIALIGLSSVFIHEFGHLLLMRLLNFMPREIILQPAGIIIKKNVNINSYLADFLIAVSGSFLNFLFAGVGYYYYSNVMNNEIWMLFAASNIMIGIFNLMPVYGLDGYDIVRIAMLKVLKDEGKAQLISKIISAVVLIFLIMLIVYFMYQYSFNLNLCICVVYLLILLLINFKC